ncbi:MAG: hypothetical protein WC472_00180 [Candidatus Paceibacterota bacterium]
MKERKEIIKKSAVDKLNVNLWLLGILFTVFTFLIATNAQVLRDNNIIAFQLTAAIPLMMSSIFARQRLSYSEKREKEWYDYGFIMFILAYGFLINSVGITIAYLINIKVSMFFFLINILNPVIYSYMEIMDDKTKIKSRIIKDGFFIIVIIVLGILPALNMR